MSNLVVDRRLEALLRENREEILEIAERHGAVNVRLFGSVAHGLAGSGSDVDLLVDERTPVAHGFPNRLAVELEALLGCRVDVVPERLLAPLLRPAVVASAIPLTRPLPHIPPPAAGLVVKDDRLYLHHILESIDVIETIADRGREAFLSDRILRDAALRNLQTMAESATRLSLAAKARHPEIDWEEIRGFRNRIAHGYLHIDMSVVWSTIERERPGLRAAAAELLEAG
jgi:uncharacterized protein with HEPN domain/predicted nucleotidyltransferase